MKPSEYVEAPAAPSSRLEQIYERSRSHAVTLRSFDNALKNIIEGLEGISPVAPSDEVGVKQSADQPLLDLLSSAQSESDCHLESISQRICALNRLIGKG